MILKLLLMILMFGIIWFFLTRKRRAQGDGADDDGGTLPVNKKQLGIGIGVAMSIVAGLIFALKWQSDQKIIVLQVVSPTETTVYKARQKDIRDRSFITLDGLEISLGDDDRLVITR